MIIHVECLPDETLLKKIGFTKKQIKHHGGKSRVFTAIKDKTSQIAVIDEDPGSARTKYEQELFFREETHGIKYYFDTQKNNKVFVLKTKLEDWILFICKKANVDIKNHGLPDRPNDLHDVINNRLPQFENLLTFLLQNQNAGLLALKNYINSQ